MWNMKFIIILVVSGATRTVTEGLKKNLESRPGKDSVDSLQKTAILGTSRIIWKVLQSETCSMVEEEWYQGEKVHDKRRR
jgi:hypothetical protein